MASFSFDDENLTDSRAGKTLRQLVTGLNPYSGRMEYVDGYDGGKGIQLGDYGLSSPGESWRKLYSFALD